MKKTQNFYRQKTEVFHRHKCGDHFWVGLFWLQTKAKLVNPTQSSSKGFFRDYGSGVPSNGS